MSDSDSAARSRAFYRHLGPTGLAIRTTPAWDRQILDALVEFLPASGRVLDVGCGYGRVAVPLAQRGYNVTGLDVAPNLLRAARRDAAAAGASVRFDRGSMTAMPYEDASFDAVVSIWSAFAELLEPDEQVAALHEMGRVLRPGGSGVIDLPTFAPATDDDVASGRRRGTGHRIRVEPVAGQLLQQYEHDAVSLGGAAAAAGLEWWRVAHRTWAGRERQLLRFGHREPPTMATTLAP